MTSESQSPTLYFPYRVAVASDNVRTIEQPVRQTVVLEIRAFGHLPKSVALSIPGTPQLDASLAPAVATGPSCEPRAAAATPDDVERAFELALLANNDEALKLFRQAYERTKQPELLVDIAESEKRLGNTAEASSAYARFLAACPRSLGRDDVRDLLRTLTAP